MSRALRLAAAALALATPATALAGATLHIDDTKFITVGLGLRVVTSATLPTVGGTTDPSQARPDFSLENALLGLTGQLRPELKLQLNVARQPTGELRFLDVIGMFEPLPILKVWAGRMLPPVDRASFIGPLFANTWDVPFVGLVGTQPAGREDGVTVWGEPLVDRIRYQVGAFRGVRGPSNPLGRLMYAARVTLNLLDPEPGYYHMGTTYGGRDVLSFGVGGRYQRSATGTKDLQGDLSTLAVDGLFEKKLAFGVVTTEAAVYLHRNGGVVDPTFAQGTGAYGLLGYLLPWPVGPGRFQVVGRYQFLSGQRAAGAEELGPAHTREDLNVNYVIQGHPLRLGLVGLHESGPAGAGYGVKLGMQCIL